MKLGNYERESRDLKWGETNGKTDLQAGVLETEEGQQARGRKQGVGWVRTKNCEKAIMNLIILYADIKEKIKASVTHIS